MPVLDLAGFDGLEPRTSPTMLAQNKAQRASNARLQSGDLHNWNGPAFVANCGTPGAQTIYLMRNVYTGDTRWLSWVDQQEVVPGPVTDAGDTRVYFTGPAGAFKTNWALASTGPGPYPAATLPLGVPAPTVAPTVSAVTGASLIIETRVYVETYVSTFGPLTEESAPGPASAAQTLAVGQGAALTLAAAPSTTANLTKRRIYRSQSTSSGAIYQFVVELPIATTTYTDNLTAAQLSNTLPSLGWLQPPTGLRGLISLTSGALAGFVDNTLYFSEPGYPHAWPLKYAITLPHKVVGLATYATSIVVGTEGYPYLLSGDVPGNFSVEKVPQLEPCVSRRSMVSEPSGVSYASPNGLMTIGSYSREVTTHALMRRQEWQAYNPSTLQSCMYDDQYFGLYAGSTASRFFVVTSSTRAELLQQPTIFRVDRSALTELAVDAVTLFIDPLNAALYYLNRLDNKIYQLDVDPLRPLLFEWLSKRFVSPRAVSYSRIKIDADYVAADVLTASLANIARLTAANTAAFPTDTLGRVNGAALNVPLVDGSGLMPIPAPTAQPSIRVTVQDGAGNTLAQVQAISFDPLPLPPFKSRDIQMLITGDVAVRSIKLATSLAELKGEASDTPPPASG